MEGTMNINKLKGLFVDSSDFPVTDCCIESKKEDYIIESNKSYLVLIENKDYPDYLEMKIMYPYICTEGEASYGWNDIHGNPIDNKFNPVKGLHDEYVIGYIDVDIDLVSHFWEACKQTVENDELPDDYRNGFIVDILQKQFHLSTEVNFPEKECYEEDVEDKDVKYAKDWYLCLVIDKRFKNEFVVKKLKPYTCKMEGIPDLQYGWVDKENDFTDNFIRSVHSDIWYEFVVAFAKVENI